MRIYTVKGLHSYQWIELPIDHDVIAQVIELSDEYNAKKMTDNYPMFEWEPCVLITDNVSEEDTPTREETKIKNNEPEGEVNVEEANENNDNYRAEYIEDNTNNNEIVINDE